MTSGGRIVISNATATVTRMAYRAWKVPESLVVRGLPYPCWNCHHDDLAVAAVHVEGLTDYYDVVQTDHHIPLSYAHELLADAGHSQAASIKIRYSKTQRGRYLSNGCLRCDALFGAFFIGEQVSQRALNDGGIASLPILLQVERPLAEWALLKGLGASSDFFEEYPHA